MKTNLSYRLYLYHDVQNNHVVGSIFIPKLCERTFNEAWKWCFNCHYCYNSKHVTHDCNDENRADKIKTTVCKKCNASHIVGQHGNCPLIKCKTCEGHYARNVVAGEENEKHRCILFHEPFKDKDQLWNTELNPGGKVEALLSYDLETFVKRIPSPRANIAGFTYDNNGHLIKGNSGYVKQMIMEADVHTVNWISVTDVKTRFTKVFFSGDNNPEPIMKMFIRYVTCDYNKGFNTLIAHNAKSYDGLFVAADLYNNIKDKNVSMIRRGRKILQLKVSTNGNKFTTRFIDSITHLPGSLASLYKAFCGGALAKGYYPYSFNSPENYNYIGAIPAKKHFGVYERAKDKKEIDTFEKWWEEERVKVGDTWNYRDESLKYSVEDTEGLAEIINNYDVICNTKFKASPWKCMTGPSFRHKLSLELITKNLFDKYQNNHGVDLWELRKSDPIQYANIITQLAKTETWAALKPFEYAPARAAMRGGRTECFQMYASLTKEEFDAGVRFKHV